MPASKAHRDPAQRRPRLADLIDVELQLLQDRAAPLGAVRARDAAIGERLAGRGLEGRARVLGWLDALREAAPRSTGQQIEELRDLVAAVLGWLGLAVGVSVVGGWLHAGTGVPVNVIHFWPAIVGVQLGLLALLCAIALPARALRLVPGFRSAHSVLRGLGSWIPAAVGALLLRFSGSGRELAPRLAELRRLDWLYARLRLWISVGLTQCFAVGFNVGALLAFIALPYIDDPAFGWRSRLLEPAAVQRMAEIAALPWRAAWPAALPSRETVEATRYSSIDPRFAREERRRGGEGDPWAAWWPFLVASLLCYGLAPRLALWGLARAGTARALARARLDHSDAARLLERLARVESRAPQPDAGAAEPGAASRTSVAAEAPDLASRPVRALCWSGVRLRAEDLLARLRERSGAAAVTGVSRVGGLDPAQDARALAELHAAPAGTAAVLFVEAWEPPVADYTDFLRSAREALGPGAPLLVWLVEREDAHVPAADAPLAQWQRRLAALSDPWLRVIAPAPAEARAR